MNSDRAGSSRGGGWPTPLPPERPEHSESRARLIESPRTRPGEWDAARANLLLASGLPGAADLDVAECLATLDRWASVVRDEIERCRRSFRPNPSCPSDACYRGYMLIHVLREHFGLKHYLLPRGGTGFVGDVTAPLDGSSGFEDSGPVFLHGLLGPERLGSCSSLPVLYAAVGRRLGYPIRLGLAVGHVFIRWDGDGELFNLEGSGPDYVNRHPDAYYIDKPRPWTAYERESGYYLRSITAAEELALFLSLRAACLHYNGHLAAARSALDRACQLAPRDPMYPAHLRAIR